MMMLCQVCDKIIYDDIRYDKIGECVGVTTIVENMVENIQVVLRYRENIVYVIRRVNQIKKCQTTKGRERPKKL